MTSFRAHVGFGGQELVKGCISPHTVASVERKAAQGCLLAATACPQRQDRMHLGAQLGIPRDVCNLCCQHAGGMFPMQLRQ